MASIVVKDGNGTSREIAVLVLSDASFSNLQTVTDGTSAGTPVNPANKGNQDTMITSLAALVAGVDHSTTGHGNGIATVVTATTAVPLVGSPTPAKWVTIQSDPDNPENDVTIGGLSVVNGQGIVLDAGASITLACSDLDTIGVNAATNGSIVSFIYGT